ncbi:MAG: hypothetical protein RMY34_24805 [Aulosira sp. DedQUE10]|nr:hypothetical protein [Aulosira sp. DedQUE10]
MANERQPKIGGSYGDGRSQRRTASDLRDYLYVRFMSVMPYAREAFWL